MEDSSQNIENPRPEQTAFAESVLSIIGPTAEKFGFKKILVEIKTYWSVIVFRKGKLYVKIASTSYPTDYPNYYDVILGEGKSHSSGNYWNSVTTLRLAKIIDPAKNAVTYNFPYDDRVKMSIEAANKDLIKYGLSFLSGDLSVFSRVRKKVNEELASYNIAEIDFKPVKFDESGIYQIHES